MKELLRSTWVRLSAAVVAFGLLSWLLYSLRGVLTPFGIAFGIAYFLNPAVNSLERLLERSERLRRHHPRVLAVGLLVLAVLVVVGVVVLVVVPKVVDQVKEAVVKLPEWIRSLRAKAEPLLASLKLRYPDEAERLGGRVDEFLRQDLPHVLAPLGHVAGAAFSSLLEVVLFVLHVVVVPVFTVYLLADMNQIRMGIHGLVPERYRDYVGSRVGEIDALLSAFIRGQITVCLLLGTFYAIGLTLCGVPMGLLVGYVVAFFNMVPYMSTALGLPLVVLLSFISQQSASAALTVAALFVAGHVIESHFVTPKIVGGRLGLHPVIIMLAILIGGTLFGFLGMLLAVPTTAALSVFWPDLRGLYLRSGFYRGDPAPGGPSA